MRVEVIANVFWKEFILAFLIAAVLTAVFVLIARKLHRRNGFTWFFLIVLTATWAGGVWLQPIGPLYADVYWMPFLAAGLIMAVFASILQLRRPPRGRQETLDKLDQQARAKKMQEATYITLRALFWVVFILFLAGIVLRYVVR